VTRTDYSFNLSYLLSIVAHHRRNGQVFTQDQEELILIGAFGLFWFGKSQVRLFSGNTVRYRFHNPESISGDCQKPSPEGVSGGAGPAYGSGGKPKPRSSCGLFLRTEGEW
jgi:hypothetical protein